MEKFKAFWASSVGLMLAGCLCGLLGMAVGVWATSDVNLKITLTPKPCQPNCQPAPSPVPPPAKPCPCRPPKGPGDQIEAGPCDCDRCQCPNCECPPSQK